MLKHNLLVIYRNFKRFKGTFLINLIGLSTGLACVLLIYLWVSDELSVDKHNAKDSRLFQVMQNLHDVNGTQTIAGTPGVLAKALADEMPEIEYATSVVPADWFSEKGILAFGEKRLRAGSQFVGDDYFNIFSCDFLAGSKEKALTDKYGMAISSEIAMKLFNTTQNVVGKTVEWHQRTSSGVYHITGIFEKPPANATAQFDILLNYDIFLEAHPWLTKWGNSDPSTFVLLREGTNVALLDRKIENFVKSKYGDSNATLFLQRYSDRYLHGRYVNGRATGGRIEYIKLFSIIAILILVIACINFMNLSTARASRRLKEVGIRKTVGAGRKTLVLQYFGESLSMSLLSALAAAFLVELILPQFNAITGKQLVLSFNAPLVLSVLAITLITGVLSGSYPAVYLSRFRPAEVLRGKLPAGIAGAAGELWARKGLVIFQFGITAVLLVSFLVVYQQIKYIQSKNLGYNRDNIVHFDLTIDSGGDQNFFAEGGAHEKNVEAFLNEVKGIPGVLQATNFNHDLMGDHGSLGGVDWQAGNEDESISFSNLEVGYDFIETLGIEMAAGRSFSKDFSNERAKVIFNQAAIDIMGLNDPVGKTIRLWGEEKQIIGVARNFHFESLFEEVKPCLFQLEPRGYRIMVKIRGGAERETLAQLERIYQAHNPGLAFDYKFLDQEYQTLYVAEQRVSVLSRYFAGFAILISCLGLLGLAAFTAERRLKEIGIRKVLGATAIQLVGLLSKDFVKLVLAAELIAMPVGWFLMHRWLQNFAYRIDIGLWILVVSGALTFAVALLTVSTQAIRAALANPVKSLRWE